MNLWDYSESGNYVDLGDGSIFSGAYQDTGFAPEIHAFVGLDVPVGKFGDFFTLEGRYYWAEDRLGGNFYAKQDLTLDGGALFFGFTHDF